MTLRSFAAATILIILCGILRSWWATGLDGFTFDEAYHIAAGATYVRTRDFRINPEHPPLVKLIVGAVEPASMLHLGPLPHFSGKYEERKFTETAVFVDSDATAIQQRARIAMLTFHGALMLLLAFLVRRLFGPRMALLFVFLLLLDPTVAALMPVVMTDLPMALLGMISACCAALLLRERRWIDTIGLGLSVGLLLATKHSAPLIALPIAIGCALLVLYHASQRQPWATPVAQLLVAAMLAVALLWGSYGFRYTESASADQTFNRSLELKISDLQSARYRAALTFMAQHRLLPRAYIWGLADTVRAGIDGRGGEVHVFGSSYEGRPPAWVPLAFIAVKIPLGILALLAAGIVFLARGRLGPRVGSPLVEISAVGFFFLGFVCLQGVPYAGVRHLLFILPIIFLICAGAAEHLLQSSRAGLALVVVALLSVCVTVLPQRRIWEYHNLLAGGTANAWRYFNNESLDLGQRSTELIEYYKTHVTDKNAHVDYLITEPVLRSAGIPHFSIDFDKPISSDVEGWFFLDASSVAPHRRFDLAALRSAEPVARFGNLMIFHGTFHLPGYIATKMYWRAQELMYVDPSDPDKAEKLLQQITEMEPRAYEVAIDLGNFDLGRNSIPGAVSWYQKALGESPPQFKPMIAEQIARLSTASASGVAPLHNPSLE